MGIRFLCPNGHKLNVKAFLAGKRGICPQCDAKFLVPHESGGQVEAVSESVLAAAAEVPDATAVEVSAPRPIAAEPPPMPAPAPTSTEPAATTPGPPPEMWYVRTEAGDQFGPADTTTMTGWVAEGRVAVDSWVWRTGWPDWKTGGQAITLLNGPTAELPSVASPPSDAPAVVAGAAPAADVDPLPEANSATVAYRTSRRNRQERARKVTLILGVVVLLLLAVLISVLMKSR